MYIAGYAVECLVKAKLMEMFNRNNLEQLEVELKARNIIRGDASLFDHRIELYLRATGRMDVLKNDKSVWRCFKIVNQWTPSWRYDPNLSTEPDARVFLASVDELAQWINRNI